MHKTSNILCTLRYIIVFYCHECLGCICVVFLCYVDLFSPCGKIFLFLAPLPSCKVIRFANNDIAEIFPKIFLNYFSTIFLPSCKRGHPLCQQCADAQEAKVVKIIIINTCQYLFDHFNHLLYTFCDFYSAWSRSKTKALDKSRTLNSL